MQRCLFKFIELIAVLQIRGFFTDSLPQSVRELWPIITSKLQRPRSWQLRALGWKAKMREVDELS